MVEVYFLHNKLGSNRVTLNSESGQLQKEIHAQESLTFPTFPYMVDVYHMQVQPVHVPSLPDDIRV